MSITATMVKELRESTGAGMMDAKKALTETSGDFESLESLNENKEKMFPSKSELTEDDLPF